MHQSKINDLVYDSEIITCDRLLKSKQSQVNTYMEMSKMYQDMGNMYKTCICMVTAETLMASNVRLFLIKSTSLDR